MIPRYLRRTLATKTEREEVFEGIRQLRKRLGLSLTEFAKQVGCHRMQVWKWEQERALPFNTHLRTMAKLDELNPENKPPEKEI